MSVSFWINLAVCFGALVFACFEHAEVREEFRSATGKKRRNDAAKLVLLWLLPVTTLIAVLFSARESIISEKEIRRTEETFVNTSNRLAQVTQDLERTSGKAEELEHALKPRVLTQQQKEKFIELSRNCPKVEVRIASSNPSVETAHYMEQLDELLSSAGFQVYKKHSIYPSILPNFVDGQSVGLMVGVPIAPNCAVSLKRCMDAIGITSSIHPWIFTNGANGKSNGFVIKTNEIVVFVTEKQYAN